MLLYLTVYSGIECLRLRMQLLYILLNPSHGRMYCPNKSLFH